MTFRNSYPAVSARQKACLLQFKYRAERWDLEQACTNKGFWNAALDWSVGAGIVEALRARDQDVTLAWPVLEHAFERLVALHGDHDVYMSKLTHEPQYFDVFM